MASASDETIQLAKIIVEFCKNTVKGHESGFFKLISRETIPMSVSDLSVNNNVTIKNFIINATGKYLNSCYRSLIREDDPFIVNEFLNMTKIMKHSEICLLNIIFSVILKIHLELDRTKLNHSSYENYMTSVRDEINIKSSGICDILSNSLSHNCDGIDISTCDPDDDMFVFSKTPST
jgi:hypothetical protein